MNLKEYIHKAVGICGVSAGPFGGARVIEALLPVMRELGLVTIFNDVNFANAGKIFGEDGRLLDEGFVRRTAKPSSSNLPSSPKIFPAFAKMGGCSMKVLSDGRQNSSMN